MLWNVWQWKRYALERLARREKGVLRAAHTYTVIIRECPPPPGNRTSIFHRMRNIVPLHRSKPLAICFVQHLEYQRNRIRLIRISYLGWVKFHSFYSSWLNIASARSKRNAYFIHKTISVRDKTAQIHTKQRKVIVTSYALLRMDVARPCNSTQLLNGWAPIGAYTTSLPFSYLRPRGTYSWVSPDSVHFEQQVWNSWFFFQSGVTPD